MPEVVLLDVVVLVVVPVVLVVGMEGAGSGFFLVQEIVAITANNIKCFK